MNGSPTSGPPASVRRVPGSPAIAFDRQGSGPPVVFLHGVGGNRTNWAGQLAALSDEFTAMAIDQRGYGDSDDFEPPLHFADVGDDLARVLDHLGVATAHLVGISMGGRVLLETWRSHAARFATLTLCSVFPSFASTLTAEAREEYVARRREPLLAGKTPADIAPSLAERLTAPGTAPEIVAELAASIAALRVDPYLATVEAATKFDASDVLATIDVPTLLIYGDQDPLTPPGIGEDAHRRISGSSLEILAGIGHLVNLEAPERFNAILSEFLRRHAAVAAFAADRV